MAEALRKLRYQVISSAGMEILASVHLCLEQPLGVFAVQSKGLTYEQFIWRGLK
jgi:hypothetical protein